MNAIMPAAPAVAIAFDIRETFLICAATRWQLVEAGDMELDEAIDGLLPIVAELVPGVIFACDTCGGQPCANPRFCEQCRIADRKAVRYRPTDARRPTPQVTIEALWHGIRERGVQALREPANIERLSRCDKAAREDLNKRIAKFIERKD